ncbi:hypothetical protein [Kordia sp.]|uniref:hypothetical protein n=1 Tax=Kordia sp. TaxID=1965332 RepID=UPI003D2A07E7
MKKKNLKSLHVKKATISNLNMYTISGGTDIFITSIIRTIPIPQATATTCSKYMECDSIAACTAHVCKTNEFDTETRPIC